jgi:hypothetical protein
MMEFPNDEQNEFIRQQTFLPLLLHVFQRDRKIIEASALKTKGPYIKLMDQVISQIEQDLLEVRKKLRKCGIYIYEEKRNQEGMELKYKYKGYHHSTGFVWHVITHSVEKLMETYLTQQ